MMKQKLSSLAEDIFMKFDPPKKNLPLVVVSKYLMQSYNAAKVRKYTTFPTKLLMSKLYSLMFLTILNATHPYMVQS